MRHGEIPGDVIRRAPRFLDREVWLAKVHSLRTLIMIAGSALEWL
ncbi:hypothetical protein [Pseudofrankia inefficax]|nr:hypothetical protein [Pseudofrankia inefficax]